MTGIDGSAPLIDAARAADAADAAHAAHEAGDVAYDHVTYDERIARPERIELAEFDVVVCNFSLLHEAIKPLLGAFAALLADGGALVVQTVHPWSARDDAGYVDGWRTEAFAGFAETFAEPMPWYFRTLASWSGALHRAGYVIARLDEPAHPATGEPLSLLVVATPVGR